MTKIKKILKILLISIVIVVGMAAAFFGGCAAVIMANNRYYLPVSLQGEQTVTVEYGETYEEAGAKAQFYGTLLHTQPEEVPVTTDTNVDTGKLGTQLVKYVARTGNHLGTAYRKVLVVDTKPPEITLKSDPEHYTEPGEKYQEEGYTALDNCDGDITDRVKTWEEAGVVYYTVSDASGNTVTVQREIVYRDTVAPVLGLNGSRYITLVLGEKFNDPGYLAADNLEGDLTKKVKVSGKVDTGKTGVYTLKYTVSDSFGNRASTTRKITVVDKVASAPGTVIPSGKVIYLTFDDGPSKHTGRLLDVLKKYNVKATFFVTKKPRYYSLITRAHNEGHAIAIHTMSHTYKKIYASDEAYYADLYGMQDIIKSLTGETTTLLRFPGGSSNTVSKKYSKGLMRFLTNDVVTRGFRYFDWNVDSKDAGGAKSADAVFRNVVSGVSKKQYAVVLQHDTKGYSVDAVERIIVWGLENGYSFQKLTTTSPTCHHTVRN